MTRASAANGIDFPRYLCLSARSEGYWSSVRQFLRCIYMHIILYQPISFEWHSELSWPRFNIKTVFTRYGDSRVIDKTDSDTGKITSLYQNGPQVSPQLWCGYICQLLTWYTGNQCHDTHYNDAIMGTIASQITSLTIVYWTVYLDADQKKPSKLCVAGLCTGKSPETGEFPAQMASNAENVSIWWRHHGLEIVIWRNNKMFGSPPTPVGFSFSIISAFLINLIARTQGPLCYPGLTLIPAWKSNHMLSKERVEIIYQFLDFNGGATVAVWEWISNLIPHIIIGLIPSPC